MIVHYVLVFDVFGEWGGEWNNNNNFSESALI
jgi:hypothetical protein